MHNETIPAWNLNALYAGPEDPGYTTIFSRIKELTNQFNALTREGPEEAEGKAAWLRRCLDLYNELGDSFEELEAYATMWYSTNTTDAQALAELNRLEDTALPIREAEVAFKNRLAEIADELPDLYAEETELERFRHFIDEQLYFQQHQMSAAEESVAADLMRSGANAWSRLFQAVSSTAEEEWDCSTGERKTVTELRGLAFSPDRELRRKAWEKELAAVEKVEVPLAYAMNGVKGATLSLNRRRGHGSTLEKSIRQARISPATLEALTGVMEESLPIFRRYLSGKAQLLGVERLGFYDLFAPVGNQQASWSFTETRQFILRHFRSFSPELAEFAEHVFEGGWIDARPRQGKVDGGYCISLPLTGESRILTNFSGNFGDVKTLAHEIGHAYHHHVLKDAPHIHRQYPMTLAETASIFAESVVFDGALGETNEEEKLPLVEKFLQNATQVIVDILSRYKFEYAVLERRAEGELSPAELKRLMLWAQKETYGEALDPETLHPYMWAIKPHYYRPELSFYNFPYAFGQLFGLGLYTRYLQEGENFKETYRELLQRTGRASAVEVTREAGFDIESSDFWRRGIETIRERVDEFLRLL